MPLGIPAHFASQGILIEASLSPTVNDTQLSRRHRCNLARSGNFQEGTGMACDYRVRGRIGVQVGVQVELGFGTELRAGLWLRVWL